MSEPSWLTPNIVNGGAGWKVAQTHFDPGPFPPFDSRWQSQHSSIVVLVAALRETRLAATLESFYKKAAYPDRVFFAIVQQNAEEDEDVIEGFCEKMGTPLLSKRRKHDSSGSSSSGNNSSDSQGEYANNKEKPCPYFDQIRVIRMSSTEARGPVFARARQAELVKEEDDFCMQIDAHTVVIENWDLRMLAEWGATNNEYAVLTAYPTNFKDLDQNSNNHWEMPHMCGASFEGFGRVRNAQASAAANLEVPILTPLWAAGLSFHRCHAERQVPNDINLKGVFSGEEFSRGARLWTHGYDFYTIRRPIIGTYYGGEKGGKGSWHASPEETSLSNNRMATLLRWPGSDQSASALKSLSSHALGTRRSLEMYINFSGVDTINQKVVRTCDSLVYVPWVSPDSVYTEITKTKTLLAFDNSQRITGLVEPRSLRVVIVICVIIFFVFIRLRKWFRLKDGNPKYSV